MKHIKVEITKQLKKLELQVLLATRLLLNELELSEDLTIAPHSAIRKENKRAQRSLVRSPDLK